MYAWEAIEQSLTFIEEHLTEERNWQISPACPLSIFSVCSSGW